MATGAVFKLDGAFEQTGPGNVSIGGNIQTTDDVVSFAGPIDLSSNLSINTLLHTGGDVTFSNTLDQPFDLNVTAGTGSVTFSGNVGTSARIGNITLASAGDVNAMDVTAASLTQVAGTGTTTFAGSVDINSVAGIALTGNAFAFDSTVTTTESGPIVLTNEGELSLGSAAALSIDGTFTQTGDGPVTLGGSVTAKGNISFASPVTLANPTSLDTSANSNDITFDTIDGPSSLTLNLGAGGNLLIAGDVGATTPTGDFTIDNANNITAQNITAATITQSAGSDISSFRSLNSSAVGGINLTTTTLAINGNLITTAAGPVAISNSGSLSIIAGPDTSISGTFTQSGGGDVSLGGTVLTTDGAILFTNPVNLVTTTTVSNSGGTGNITFNSSLDGNQNLTLNAGTGNVLFLDDVGEQDSLKALTIQNGADVTYQGVSASSINQEASSGITLISGPMNTSGVNGISLTGSTITQNNTIITSNGGPIAITNSGTWTKGALVQADGGFTQSGGLVTLGGSITTASNNISLGGTVTLASATSLNAGSGLGDIIFTGTIDGGNNLTLTAGIGNILLSNAVAT